MIKINIGENLKSIRQEHGYSRRKLADLCGVSSGYLEEIENGKKTPTIEILLKISKVYQTTVSMLIGEVNDDISPDMRQLLIRASKLNEKQLKLLNEFIEAFSNDDNSSK